MADYFMHNRQALDYSMAMVPKIREMSAPLFSNTKINNFSYLKFHKNGSVLNLTTENKWIQYRFDKKIEYKILFKDSLITSNCNTPHTYLWPDNASDPLLGALHQYDIWNGCNIYMYNSDFIEVFSFATSVEHINMQNFYINNLDLLRGYILYFREQIKDITGSNANKHLIMAGLEFPNDYDKENRKTKISYEDFFGKIKPKRIHIGCDFYLTQKEIECCIHLMKGKNVKTIAQETNISPRTVETHINNIKLKTNSFTKANLIKFINHNRWIFDAFSIRS